MSSKIKWNIVSNFFLDGSKILFGSLVVGMFMPNAAAIEFPWITFGIGITLTTVFLIMANMTAENHRSSLTVAQAL